MNNPKITIITPSFNQGQYLEQTILSVINQPYPNIEYIIIDGGGTDNSASIIKKYEKHLKYWVSEKDEGQSYAINKGLQFATGDIINWLNSDDYLAPEVFPAIAKYFSDPTTNILCGYSKLLYADEVILSRSSSLSDNFPKAIATGKIMQPSTFFRKTVFDELTPLDNDLHYMMDHYLWLKYITSHGVDGIKYTDAVLANVVMHEETKSLKHASHFKDEADKIYSSLLKSIKNKTKQQVSLPFIINYEPFISSQKGIRFYLLYNTLFKRNQKGKIKKLILHHLIKIIINYPAFLLREIVIKLK